MYGAIIGDIIGSRFEFDRGHKTKEFELFTKRCEFTDDTVMTVAVAEALMDAGPDANEEKVKALLIKSMKKWGHVYPGAGYGGRFVTWLFSRKTEPYGSYGNGSGMRVSPVGWLYDSIERTREVARWTAEVTHNHPEGIKGAESVAAAIYLARTGSSMEEIADYIKDEFGYDLSRTVDEIRPGYHHVEDCMHTMPEAFTCFLESESYEDCIRNVMSIGGDTDTLGAIAGAVAEAYWGIPVTILIEAKKFIPKDIEAVVERFHSIVFPSNPELENTYENNKYIKMAIKRFYQTKNEEDLAVILGVLRKRMAEGGEAPMPMIDVNGVMDGLNPDNICPGKDIRITEEVRLRMDTVTDEEGNEWFPLFTDEEELNKQPTSNIVINSPIREILRNGLTSDRVKGVVINPFGERIAIPQDVLKLTLKDMEE